MREELKSLYRKDKKLAKQVAKVLGFKIVAKDKKSMVKDIKSYRKVLTDHLKFIDKKLSKIDDEKTIKKVYDKLSKMMGLSSDIVTNI